MGINFIPIIYKICCRVYHCSDSMDKQYPECKEYENTLICPALKIVDIYEEIEQERLKESDE